jgi:hypothetical protein
MRGIFFVHINIIAFVYQILYLFICIHFGQYHPTKNADGITNILQPRLFY